MCASAGSPKPSGGGRANSEDARRTGRARKAQAPHLALASHWSNVADAVQAVIDREVIGKAVLVG